MNDLDILLPFGLPPSDTARDLIRECKAPAFATLLSRTAAGSGQRAVDPFARALAHENWLAQRFGFNAGFNPGVNASAVDNSPPLAHAAMRALGLPAVDGHWFILHPTHIHIARDHLILTDMRQLMLEPDDARALFEAAQALCAEAGKILLYGSADTWFMRADDWPNLRTATPDAASGRSIDIWMPLGEGDRAWRKLQNEIQMHWFAHPLDERREERGLKPVNSLWLWGGADAVANKESLPSSAAQRYSAVFKLSGWMQLFGQFAGTARAEADAADLIETPGARGLLILDALTEPALSDEWGYWLERIETLEQDWFAPLLSALKTGQLRSLGLILSGQDRIAEYAVSRNSLRKFWIKPSLQRLAS